jgi:phage terminase small subunit
VALTAKQEAFCLAYLETGNASEAYRDAYRVKPGTKPESVHRAAKGVLDNAKIASRLDELRAPVREKAMLTLENHLERLNHLSNMAEQAGQFGPAIKAEESRGKAAGLYVERIEHGGEIITKIERTIVSPKSPNS